MVILNFQWIREIVDLIEKDTLKGLILLAILLVLLFIFSVLSYKKSSLLQRLVNFLPFVKKEFALIANFSKKEANINEVKNYYLESGCKVFSMDTHKFFERDGTITKDKLENVIERQHITINKAKEIMKNKNSLIYLGFPHVPLGFLDGKVFSDVNDPILYDYQGMDTEYLGKGFFELKRTYNTDLQLDSNFSDIVFLNKEIALKIEQSFKINEDDIIKIIDTASIVSLNPKEIGRWKIANYAQIDKYQRKFELLLTELKDKGVEKIHLFATTPVSLSFSLGRVINHYHPEIIVYNYNNGMFDWGINMRNFEIVYSSQRDGVEDSAHKDSLE